MAPEAKFDLSNYKSRKQNEMNFIEYIVNLHDADGEKVSYNITDYYNDENEITETKIWQFWKLEDPNFNNKVECDSKLGKAILTFVTNEHFYRSDTLEAMYVKENE